MLKLMLGSMALLLLFACQTTKPPVNLEPPPALSQLQPELPERPQEASYYVSTTGNNQNSGRSEDDAFKTIAHALEVVKPGDVVFIKGGRYQEKTLQFTRSGTKVAPITFMSAPGERAIIDWSSRKGGRDKEALRFSGVNYIVMRDITIYKGPQQCVLLQNGSSHNIFINMDFNGCWGSGLQIFQGSFNIVAYSTARNNYGGGNSDGFGSIGQGGKSTGNEFWYNLADNNADDGFDSWKATHTLFFGNIAKNNGYNGGDGNGFKLGSSNNHAQNIVRRNIAYSNTRSGFDNNVGGGNIIENNTAWNNQRHNFESSRAVRNNIWRNNLSLAGSVGMFDDTIEERNSWNLKLNKAMVVSFDPDSVDFLSLAKNSPAVDRGKEVGLPFVGSAPDLGALEHGMTIQSLRQ